jgi:hypothetical protein
VRNRRSNDDDDEEGAEREARRAHLIASIDVHAIAWYLVPAACQAESHGERLVVKRPTW